jgi:hypothetical protein
MQGAAEQMRGFLMFLAVACPVVLASPIFWSLVAMSWSASPVTYINHDGTRQEALLGPKAPWPDWAIRPDDAELRVKSWFGPSPRSAANGMGDLTFRGEPRAAAGAYVEKLRREGWVIETGRFEAPLPAKPPRTLVQCRVRATQGRHVVQAAFEVAPQPGNGSMFWVDAPAEESWGLPLGTVRGPC